MTGTADRPWLASYPDDLPVDLAVPEESILAMFRRVSAGAGGSPFLHYFGTTWSYLDTDRRSDALACALLDAGVAAGDRVVVYLQSSPEFVVVMLAVWKLGAVLVPANAMLRGAELTHVVSDSGATLVICLDSLYHDVAREVVERTGAWAITVRPDLSIADDPIPDVVGRPCPPTGVTDLLDLLGRFDGRRPPWVEPGGGDLALLTYTSGTTGQPKAAMNRHGNVAFSGAAMRAWFHMESADVVLGIAPLFHITGLAAQLAVAISAGCAIVLPFRFHPATVLGLVERYRATFSVGAITAYAALLDDPAARRTDLSSLTKVYTGGAPVAPAMVERFQRELGPYLRNTYGLTEMSGATHMVPHDAPNRVDPVSGALSIGVPYFNTAAVVMADDGTVLPAGEAGELVLSGPQLSGGYWQRPIETAEAYLDIGFRTGDVGYMDRDGWFYLVDRKKDMIIASGYKVWPREVEDVLYQHPGVREAAVVGVPDAYRGETVKAVVSARDGFSLDGDELVGFCRERLAAYKCPRVVEILDELPKTASGKILRRLLPRRRHLSGSHARL